eukprot:764903-Hanusia_phi.AAC.1
METLLVFRSLTPVVLLPFDFFILHRSAPTHKTCLGLLVTCNTIALVSLHSMLLYEAERCQVLLMTVGKMITDSAHLTLTVRNWTQNITFQPPADIWMAEWRIIRQPFVECACTFCVANFLRRRKATLVAAVTLVYAHFGEVLVLTPPGYHLFSSGDSQQVLSGGLLYEEAPIKFSPGDCTQNEDEK